MSFIRVLSEDPIPGSALAVNPFAEASKCYDGDGGSDIELLDVSVSVPGTSSKCTTGGIFYQYKC